jgi:hypothetical protein
MSTGPLKVDLPLRCNKAKPCPVPVLLRTTSGPKTVRLPLKLARPTPAAPEPLLQPVMVVVPSSTTTELPFISRPALSIVLATKEVSFIQALLPVPLRLTTTPRDQASRVKVTLSVTSSPVTRTPDPASAPSTTRLLMPVWAVLAV